MLDCYGSYVCSEKFTFANSLCTMIGSVALLAWKSQWITDGPIIVAAIVAAFLIFLLLKSFGIFVVLKLNSISFNFYGFNDVTQKMYLFWYTLYYGTASCGIWETRSTFRLFARETVNRRPCQYCKTH